MGLFRTLQYDATRSDVVRQEAQLAGLLADRAAGKRVEDSALKSLANSIDLRRQSLERIDRERAQEAQQQASREQEYRAQRRQEAALWEERRRAEREDLEREEEARLEARRAQMGTLREELDAHADILEQLLADASDVTEERVIDALLYSISLLDADSAQLLGAPFTQLRAWIRDADDPDGTYSTSAVASEIDEGDYVDGLLYREEIARRVSGRALIDASVAPWDAARGLQIEYPGWEANLKDVDGPIPTDNGNYFVSVQEKLRVVRVSKLDSRRWVHDVVCVIPMGRDDGIDTGVVVTPGRASRYWAIDQTGSFFMLGMTLYRIGEGRAQKVCSLDLDKLSVLGPGTYSSLSSEYFVKQQLISRNGRPLWIGEVSHSEANKAACVCVDLETQTEAWSVLETEKSYPANVGLWCYDAELDRLYHHQCVTISIQSPKKSGWQKLFSAEERAKTETRGSLIERDALTGQVLRSADLPQFDYSSHIEVRSPSTLALVHYEHDHRQQVERWVDRETFEWKAAEPESLEPARGLDAAPMGEVGDTRLPFLARALRYHSGYVDADGEVAASPVRLVPLEVAA